MSILSIGSLQQLGLENWILLSLLLFLGVAITRTLEWVWWRPKRLEKILRQQGIRGNPYKILVGDVKDATRLSDEVKSKLFPIGSHDIASRVDPFMLQLMKDYGGIFVNWLATTPRVIVTDPELAKEILSSYFESFGKQEVDEVAKFLICGVVAYDGKKWMKHRKIINPAFHSTKIKHMFPAFLECCTGLISRWEKLVSLDGSAEVDAQVEFRNLTGDVISRSAFGSSYEEGKRIFQLVDEQCELLLKAWINYFIPVYRFLPTRTNRRRKEVEREVRSLIGGIIQKRENTMKAGIKHEDLLAYLLESNRNHLEDGNSQQTGMTVDEVIDECKLFYFAGEDTTLNTLTWTMVLLAMHPSWQDRAREEVLQIFGKNKPDFDGINRMKIVTMVLNEVLRLYPPSPEIFRITKKEVQLGKFTIPKDIQLVLPLVLIHHDTRYWGQDADEFNPERFAEGVLRATKGQMGYFPFGGGPRICFGQGFAMAEAKLALSMILQRFSFELSPNYIHAPHTLIMLKPQHGAQIILRRI